MIASVAKVKLKLLQASLNSLTLQTSLSFEQL